MAASSSTCAGCSGGHAQCVCLKERRRGVLLINLGTPDRPDTKSVRRYLTQFLADPYVIKLPRGWRWLNRPLARLIAQFRAPRSAESYCRIWTDLGSPLKFITEDQVAALKKHLPTDWLVFYAMRYANPSIRDTLEQIVETGVTDLVVIPMYPHYSGPSTGTALHELYRTVCQRGLQLNVEVRSNWYDDASYIDAQARLIHKHAVAHSLAPDNAFLLYSTHSMPQSYIGDGDPYEGQVRQSVELVNERLGWPRDRSCLSFQSKLGPVPWLEPSTETALANLAEAGEKQVLVCPISFTADCLETLEEIGITYAAQFSKAGGELFLCPSLNTFEPFIKALSVLARRGSKPSSRCEVTSTPLLQEADSLIDLGAALDSLAMVGVSVPPRLDGAHGPAMRYVSSEELRRIKRPQYDMVELLQNIHREGDFRECWLWNTCNRFELYGCLHESRDGSSFNDATADIKRHLLGDHDTDLPVNVLRGADAWHHLLRTAAGLNSSLPGDTEVIEQLQSACRMARHAQTAGTLTEHLIGRVRSIVEDLRASTPWGQFGCGYCFAALRDLVESIGPPLPEAQCLVIGGSTTSRSILHTLIEQFGVPSLQLTLIYRGEGRHHLIKLLRKAIGQGRRMLVHKYSEPAVTEAIAHADVVFLGIDRKEPILRSKQLAHLRDYSARPLTVIDFNTFSSTEGMASINGIRIIDARQLEAQVDLFAETVMVRAELGSAVEAAERSILAHVESVTMIGDWSSGSGSDPASPAAVGSGKAASVSEIKDAEFQEINGHAQPAHR